MILNEFKHRFNKNKTIGFIFILPALILNLVFFVYPLITAFRMSFYNWPVLGDKEFLALSNYESLFQDIQFWNALGFTFEYTILVTPALFILAFVLAMLIRKPSPGTTFFRSVYFLPVVISMTSCSLLWLWIYNDLHGILNFYLMRIGLINEAIVWMGNKSTSLPAISTMVTWKMAGFTMIILLAGLQSIPKQLYEAAEVDGASYLQKITKITIPLLRPSIALSLVVSVIGSVLAFVQFVIMTRGGPANTTTTIVHHIYNTSFRYFRLGYGSAMGMILLVIMIALSWIQIKIISDTTN